MDRSLKSKKNSRKGKETETRQMALTLCIALQEEYKARH